MSGTVSFFFALFFWVFPFFFFSSVFEEREKNGGGRKKTHLFSSLCPHSTLSLSLSLSLPSYNIGGSGWDCPGKSDMRPGGAVPSFLGPDGKSYDWSLDAGQRWTLLAARDRGASVFEAFSNSPPCFMTNSGYASGNWDANNDNLPAKNYEVRERERRRERRGVEGGGNEMKEKKVFSLSFFFRFKKLISSSLPSFPEQTKNTGLRLLPGRGGLLLQERAQHHL